MSSTSPNETFRRLTREPFEVVFRAVKTNPLYIPLETVFKKHGWTSKEYIDEFIKREK